MTADHGFGLILRTRPLTETSLIVHWITADHGRIATVAKGARRPKSPFRGQLDLFYTASFSFHRSRRSELHTLREATVRDTHPRLRQDYARLRQAAYGALLVESMTETETPLPGVCARLLELVACLNADAARPQYLLAFELQMLQEAGLEPDLASPRLSPETRELARRFLASPLPTAARIAPPAHALAELQRFLRQFLGYHLDRIPRGRDEALAAGLVEPA